MQIQSHKPGTKQPHALALAHCRSQQRVPTAMKRNCVLISAHVQLVGQRNGLFLSV